MDKQGIYKASYYSWKRKDEQMGEEEFQHGMTPAHLKQVRELEKENMKRDKALSIAGVSKHQYYYKPMVEKEGKRHQARH